MSSDVRIDGFLFRWSSFSHKWVCDTCAAFVLAPAAHAEWHRSLGGKRSRTPTPPTSSL